MLSLTREHAVCDGPAWHVLDLLVVLGEGGAVVVWLLLDVAQQLAVVAGFHVTPGTEEKGNEKQALISSLAVGWIDHLELLDLHYKLLLLLRNSRFYAVADRI